MLASLEFPLGRGAILLAVHLSISLPLSHTGFLFSEFFARLEKNVLAPHPTGEPRILQDALGSKELRWRSDAVLHSH